MDFIAKDEGDYQAVSETIETPLKELGAYVIVANAGTVRFARVLVISDLAILKKTDRDNAFSYVADARSGEPIQDANVVLKEVYHVSGETASANSGHARGRAASRFSTRS
jgi:uncharacterized protein YfaS (alpha-2-macroglobulin family)